MSVIPLIASAADLEPAIRHGNRNPAARWYIAKRAAAMGLADVVPSDWAVVAAGMPDFLKKDDDSDADDSGNDGDKKTCSVKDCDKAAVMFGKCKEHAKSGGKKKAVKASGESTLPRRQGAGKIGRMDSITAAAWDDNLHPRDRKGRFIEKMDIIDIFPASGGDKPTSRGRAVGLRRAATGNQIIVDVELPSGTVIQVRPDRIESSPESKARLDAPGVGTDAEGNPAPPGIDLTPRADAPARRHPLRDSYEAMSDEELQRTIDELNVGASRNNGMQPAARQAMIESLREAKEVRAERKAAADDAAFEAKRAERKADPDLRSNRDNRDPGRTDRTAPVGPAERDAKIAHRLAARERGETGTLADIDRAFYATPEGQAFKSGGYSARAGLDPQPVDGDEDRMVLDGKLYEYNAARRTWQSDTQNPQGPKTPGDAAVVLALNEKRDEVRGRSALRPSAVRAPEAPVEIEEGEDGEYVYNGTPYVRSGPGDWEDYDGTPAPGTVSEALDRAWDSRDTSQDGEELSDGGVIDEARQYFAPLGINDAEFDEIVSELAIGGSDIEDRYAEIYAEGVVRRLGDDIADGQDDYIDNTIQSAFDNYTGDRPPTVDSVANDLESSLDSVDDDVDDEDYEDQPDVPGDFGTHEDQNPDMEAQYDAAENIVGEDGADDYEVWSDQLADELSERGLTIGDLDPADAERAHAEGQSPMAFADEYAASLGGEPTVDEDQAYAGWATEWYDELDRRDLDPSMFDAADAEDAFRSGKTPAEYAQELADYENEDEGSSSDDAEGTLEDDPDYQVDTATPRGTGIIPATERLDWVAGTEEDRDFLRGEFDEYPEQTENALASNSALRDTLNGGRVDEVRSALDTHIERLQQLMTAVELDDEGDLAEGLDGAIARWEEYRDGLPSAPSPAPDRSKTVADAVAAWRQSDENDGSEAVIDALMARLPEDLDTPENRAIAQDWFNTNEEQDEGALIRSLERAEGPDAWAAELGLDTLETRNSDDLDFHEVSVEALGNLASRINPGALDPADHPATADSVRSAREKGGSAADFPELPVWAIRQYLEDPTGTSTPVPDGRNEDGVIESVPEGYVPADTSAAPGSSLARNPFGGPEGGSPEANSAKNTLGIAVSRAADKVSSTMSLEDALTELEQIYNLTDSDEAHKRLAKIMTATKMGGKQRKRYRELLDAYKGWGGDDSAAVSAKETAENLRADNPVKDRLKAKAAGKAVSLGGDVPDELAFGPTIGTPPEEIANGRDIDGRRVPSAMDDGQLENEAANYKALIDSGAASPQDRQRYLALRREQASRRVDTGNPTADAAISSLGQAAPRGMRVTNLGQSMTTEGPAGSMTEYHWVKASDGKWRLASTETYGNHEFVRGPGADASGWVVTPEVAARLDSMFVDPDAGTTQVKPADLKVGDEVRVGSGDWVTVIKRDASGNLELSNGGLVRASSSSPLRVRSGKA